MYEFRAKTQHNMTSCQRLVPTDLKPNHLTKWILPQDRGGSPSSVEALLILICPVFK